MGDGDTTTPSGARVDIPQLLKEFAASYLGTSKGEAHVSRYNVCREDGRRNLSEILRAADAGRDVTDQVIAGLLPHKDTAFNRDRGAWIHIAPAVTRDLRKWFEQAGWTDPVDWPQVAGAIVRLARHVQQQPQEIESACDEFSAQSVTKGLQSALLSPLLNAINPDRFFLVNKKSLGSLALLTGARHPQGIAHYPAANARLHKLAEELSTELATLAPPNVRPADVLDAFHHWLVGVRKFGQTSPGAGTPPVTPDASDPDTVRAWFERAFPDPTHRTLCETLLSDAIEQAAGHGPACWEVAFRRYAIRLVVGFRSVLIFRSSEIRIAASLADDSAAHKALQEVGREVRRFETKPASVLYAVSPDLLAHHRDSIWPAMQRSIEQEAAGVRWRTPFYQSHAPAVVSHLSATLRRELPVPSYERGDQAEARPPAPPPKTVRFDGPGTLFKRVDYNVEKLLADIEMGDIGLPDLQRPFVWTSAKVRDLFDSMYRGFPVGYLLFWSNSQLRGSPIGVGDKPHAIPNLLVVDGQQRLTSLFAVLKGRPVFDSDFRERTIEIAFRPRDSRFEVTDAAIRNDREFIPSISTLWTGGGAYGQIASFLQNLEARKTLDDNDREAISHNLGRLFDLFKFPFTALEISPEVDEEAVADIFVRINSEGVKLKQADFILTLLSVFWPKGRDGLERMARESRTPPKPGSGPSAFNHLIALAPDRLLRVVVAVGFQRARLRNAYMVLRGKEVVTGSFSEELRDRQFERFKEAQAQVLDLKHWHLFLNCIRGVGFRSRDIISSEIALLYSYAFYLLGRLQCGADEATLERLIGRWFFAIALTGRYSGSPETIMDEDLSRVRGVTQPDLFVENIERMIAGVLTGDYWEISLPDQLETSSPRSPAMFAFYASQCRLGAPVLFSDKQVVDLLDPSVQPVKKALEKHHLFPRKWLEKEGVTAAKAINQVANFSLIEWPDNIEIGARGPSAYIPEFRGRFTPAAWEKMHSLHALPLDWETLDYDRFLEQRRALMASVIRRGFEALGGTSSGPVEHVADGSREEQEAWGAIRDLETRLRLVVRERFASKWGEGTDRQIRALLGEASAEAVDRNRNKYLKQYPLSGEKNEAHEILEFCYFGQLVQLMTANASWSLFKAPFKDKRHVEDLAAAIVPVRNDGAHFRPVPKRELTRCRLALADLDVALDRLSLIGESS